MVRTVHMNTFGRMDLGKLEIKNQFWKKTDSHQSSRELGSGKWFPGDPKYIEFEFYGSSWILPHIPDPVLMLKFVILYENMRCSIKFVEKVKIKCDK